MNDAEVIVVGAGHNGLICAAYLARAGIDTVLLEARSAVGGCASTVSDLGARFNICNCDHTMVRALPIFDDLDLESYGLEYLESEVGFVNQFYDESPPWLFFHDQERTLDSLSVSYPGQVAGYRRYLEDAIPVARTIIEMARTPPTARRLLGVVARRRAEGAARLLSWSRRSAADVFGEYFTDWRIVMPAVSTGPTCWGVPYTTPGTGLAAAAYAIRHLVRSGRPKGGSGALTDSVCRSFEAAGGRVRCDSLVESLTVTDGFVCGVQLADGTSLRADAVVAACDPHRVFVDWLGEVPARARRLASKWRSASVPDGYESKVDAVLSGLPTHPAATGLDERFSSLDLLGPTTVVCPSPEQLGEAFELRAKGEVAQCPTILLNIPSVLDDTMQPRPDQHVLSLEVLFTPYARLGGWPGSSEPERWLDIWASFFGTDARDLITDWRVMTPDRYETEFHMHRGHAPAYAASPLSTLAGSARELSRYRTAVTGLYLSGAATFPGAGIFGAPGRNAASVVLHDRRSRTGRAAGVLRHRIGQVYGAIPNRGSDS